MCVICSDFDLIVDKKLMTGYVNRLQKFLASRDIDDAYNIGAVLGRGAYSVVKTAKSKKTDDEVQYSAYMRRLLCLAGGIKRRGFVGNAKRCRFSRGLVDCGLVGGSHKSRFWFCIVHRSRVVLTFAPPVVEPCSWCGANLNLSGSDVLGLLSVSDAYGSVHRLATGKLVGFNPQGRYGVGVVRFCVRSQVAVKIVKRAGLPADDEKALKDEVSRCTEHLV